VQKPVLTEMRAQQSLPLDAPDQNAASVCAIGRVETAHGDHTKTSA